MNQNVKVVCFLVIVYFDLPFNNAIILINFHVRENHEDRVR